MSTPSANWIQRATAWLRGSRPAPAPVTRSEEAEAETENLEPGAPLDLAGLEKQIAKLGREQFKLNTLVEKQQLQVQAVLQQLREQDERREKERIELLARRPAEQAEARLQVVQRLLPVLDGLDEAIASGERLLERVPPPLQIEEIKHRQNDPSPWWANVLALPVVLTRFVISDQPQAKPSERERQERALDALSADMAAWQDAYIAWLRGLELVRERLFETLAVEGVEPIEAAGRPFDPHRHVAMDTVPAQDDTPPGAVVSELRRGYAIGDRMLRYAEVVVARADKSNSPVQLEDQTWESA